VLYKFTQAIGLVPFLILESVCVSITRLNFLRSILGEINMARIKGNDFNNLLTGTATNDTIYAYAGNDTVNAGAGNDNVSGASGNDTLNGEAGNDSLAGGAGNDQLNGGTENDTLKGDSNDDVLNGGAGNDFLYGGADNDQLNGGDDNDVMYVGDGVDVVNGGSDTIAWAAATGFTGGDWLSYSAYNIGVNVNLATAAVSGGASGDTFSNIEHLSGSKQADVLVGHGSVAGMIKGNGGNDKITAGAAAGDVLVGGTGRDTMTGVATNLDYFQLEYSETTDMGFDRINNFDSGALATSDKLIVSQKTFGLDIGTAGSTLVASGVVSVASLTDAAVVAATRFIFETDTKTLWFDADGNGAGDAYALAHIDNAGNTLAALTVSDFLVIA
jgi:Ca2+-binding RTX toxin-like protein